MTGVIIAGLLVVGGFVGWRFFNDEVRPEIEDATSVLTAFSETPPGPCLDLQSDAGLLTTWTEVPCDGPRDVEVTYAAAFNEGPFPGDEYLADEAADTCWDAFAGYVGVSPDQSEYEFSWIVPTEETWATGSRHGICLVIQSESDVLTGEIKGSED